MFEYEVRDMTCGHCSGAITRAIRSVDADAKVDIDIGRHSVRVVSSEAASPALEGAIREAGYSPRPMAPGPAATATRDGAGCCCSRAAAGGR